MSNVNVKGVAHNDANEWAVPSAPSFPSCRHDTAIATKLSFEILKTAAILFRDGRCIRLEQNNRNLQRWVYS